MIAVVDKRDVQNTEDFRHQMLDAFLLDREVQGVTPAIRHILHTANATEIDFVMGVQVAFPSFLSPSGLAPLCVRVPHAAAASGLQHLRGQPDGEVPSELGRLWAAAASDASARDGEEWHDGPRLRRDGGGSPSRWRYAECCAGRGAECHARALDERQAGRRGCNACGACSACSACNACSA